MGETLSSMNRIRTSSGWVWRKSRNQPSVLTISIEPELADDVAEVRPGLPLAAAIGVLRAGSTGRRLRPRARAGVHPLQHLAGALPLEVGEHRPAGAIDPVVAVDQEGPDAVVELLADVVALVRLVPAGELGGGHRVMRGGEGDLVERPVAELGEAVAVDDRAGRSGDLALALVAAADQDDDRDHQDRQEGGAADQDPERRRCLALPLPGGRRSDRPEQLTGGEEEAVGAEHDGDDLQRERRLEDEEEAHRAHCHGPAGPRPGRRRGSWWRRRARGEPGRSDRAPGPSPPPPRAGSRRSRARGSRRANRRRTPPRPRPPPGARSRRRTGTARRARAIRRRKKPITAATASPEEATSSAWRRSIAIATEPTRERIASSGSSNPKKRTSSETRTAVSTTLLSVSATKRSPTSLGIFAPSFGDLAETASATRTSALATVRAISSRSLLNTALWTFRAPLRNTERNGVLSSTPSVAERRSGRALTRTSGPLSIA